MQPGESGFLHLIAKVIQPFASLLQRSKCLDQVLDTKYREDRLAIDLEIIRLLEILPDNTLDHNLEVRPVDSPVPQTGIILFIPMNIPIIACHIMVCPHDVKVHLPVILRFQESIVQTSLQKRPVVEPIPVKYKRIHTIRGSSIYPTLHHLRVIIQLISPQRQFRLIMPRETRISLLDDFPLARSFGP